MAAFRLQKYESDIPGDASNAAMVETLTHAALVAEPELSRAPTIRVIRMHGWISALECVGKSDF